LVLRIAVDLDGVLADTMVTFCKILNQHHSTKFTVNSFVQWNAWQIAHIPKEEFFRTLDEAWFEWKSIPAVEDHIGDAVEGIHRFGRVDIVTGRSQATVRAAMNWLKAHKIPYEDFVRTESTKAKATLSYDVFIDDSAELMSLVASSLDTYGIIYTQPWNRNVEDMQRVFRVETWKDIPAALERIPTRKK
jgi:uncharacterized HAD superfamily protein